MAGQPRNLDSPEELWRLFEDYKKNLEWIEIEQPHVKLGTVIVRVKEPMSMEGFKAYCYDRVGVIKHYIDNTQNLYEEYCPIITHIKEIIFKNNFSRAAVGMYKENLIARQLGMADKNQTHITTEQPLFPDVPKNNSNKQDT